MSYQGPYKGRCSCQAVTYRFKPQPIFTHCCHCTDCQRESGTAFAVNAMIETTALEINGTPEAVHIPSHSGKGQTILRCPECKIALWSHYAGAEERIAFIRTGTLDNPDAIAPDVHVFTRSKRAWVELPDDIPAFETFYRRSAVWPKQALARREAALA